MKLLNFNSKDIVKAIELEKDKFARKKLQAFLLVKEDLSISAIAQKFSIHPNTLYSWIKQIKQEGLEKLQIKKGRGTKPLLNKNQLSELKSDLLIPIKTDDGYSRGWQSKDVYKHILKKYDVKYSLRRIQEILNMIGFKKIVCRPRSKRRNENLTQEFLTNVKKNEIYWVRNTN